MVEPTAVIMEDLHWADESTLQLLAACTWRAGLLVVATYRNTESNPALEDGLAVLGAGSDMWLELRPWTNQMASTGTSPVLVSRCGVEELKEIDSPAPTL